MRLIFSHGDIWALRLLRPSTYEIGGSLHVGENGRISRIDYKQGTSCRNTHGKLIAGAICSVTHPRTPTVFHTHPKANRPSSGDLRNAVQGENTHVLVTPSGIWCYRASPQLVSEWRQMSETQRRRQKLEWRFVGHHHQNDTQSGITAPFIAFCKQRGFFIEYRPYVEMTDALKTWTIMMGPEKKINA